MSLDVNTRSTKHNGRNKNLRERQFLNKLIGFTFSTVVNKRIMIPVKQQTKEFNHK